MKEEVGRRPIEVVEIDQDFCNLTYGVLPCRAALTDDLPANPFGSLNKCFNTLGTCTDPESYDAGVKTLRFCSDQNEIPDDDLYLPFLKSVKITPAEINPSGANRASSGLGKRATISAKFTDHPSTDRFLDNYYAERISGAAQFSGVGYDPFERSTFWRKWKARNQYYLYRNMRYISGYLEDGLIVDSITQSFIISGFKGADQKGNVSFQGKDILSLAQKEKAEAPRASSGKLDRDLGNNTRNFFLEPVGVGDLEYPEFGIVRIGKEVCLLRRNYANGDRCRLTRAQYNTERENHDEGDTVQLCLEYDAQLPYQILLSLLNDFSGIPLANLNVAQWIDESVTKQYLPLAYTTLITEPTPVEDLISEITEQMYFYTWFDTRSDQVLIKAVRAIAEDPVTDLSFDSNIIKNSIKVVDQPDQIVTRVVINYGMWNPAEDLDEISNYRVTDIEADLDNESEDRNRRSQTKTIFSRWLTPSAGAAALQLAQNIISRYAVPPLKIDFSIDAKDRDVWTGDFIKLSSPYVVDALGEDEPINCQVMKGMESEAGSVFSYSAQQFRFEEPPRVTEKYLRLGADRNNLVLRDWYDEQFPLTPPQPDDTITFDIENGVIVGSVSTALPALSVGSFPVGCTLILNLVGFSTYVIGKGGAGGNARNPNTNQNGQDGANGGLAMFIDFPITINNLGWIGGGGGGGGGGAGVSNGIYSMDTGGGGGGGGAGFGEAGNGRNSSEGSPPSGTYGSSSDGADGTAGGIFNGYGGYRGRGNRTYYPDSQEIQYGTTGGAGGYLGADGQYNVAASGRPKSTRQITHLYTPDEPIIEEGTTGRGGDAGGAIDGVSNVTWAAFGIVLGSLIN